MFYESTAAKDLVTMNFNFSQQKILSKKNWSENTLKK